MATNRETRPPDSDTRPDGAAPRIDIDDVINKPWDEAELPARLRATAQSKHTADKPGDASEAGKSPADDNIEPVIETLEAKKPRVLVVDDSMTICMRLTEELQASGMDAVATDRAFDALLRVQREEFDVAITDVVMPFMDGEELIQRLGKLAPKLPCIVLTGSAEMAVVRRLAKARNVAGILVKPWDRGRLLATLKSALERRETEPVRACS